MIDDLDLRWHHHTQMEQAGLERLLALCERFDIPATNQHIRSIRERLEDDERSLRERMDQQILYNLKDPKDVYEAILAKTKHTKAHDHFLSMMQHLLLIREDGLPMVHYYKLLDTLVTDVVLDKKLNNAEQRFGHSVERIIGQFNEADRAHQLSSEVVDVRRLASQLQIEKEALEEELSQGQDGLVGRLKEQVRKLEDKLLTSRETTGRLQGQLESQKFGYEERIAQLEAQIIELFRMLKEGDMGLGKMVDDNASMNRQEFINDLERKWQRHRTISKLEGKENWEGKDKPKTRRPKEEQSAFDDDSEEDLDSTPGKSTSGTKIGRKSSRSTKNDRAVDENGRVSQFMDADDEDADEQVQQQLAAGVQIVGGRRIKVLLYSLTELVHSSRGPNFGIQKCQRLTKTI